MAIYCIEYLNGRLIIFLKKIRKTGKKKTTEVEQKLESLMGFHSAYTDKYQACSFTGEINSSNDGDAPDSTYRLKVASLQEVYSSFFHLEVH